MDNKVCGCCGIDKLLSEFNKCTRNKNGVQSYCRDCNKAKLKIYDNVNASEISNKRIIKNKEHPEIRKLYRENNKVIISERNKEYREKNRETILIYQKKYREINKEILKIKALKYVELHKSHIRKVKRIYRRNKYKNNPLYALRQRIARLIAVSITNKGFKKYSKTAEILGCTFEEFYKHIESKITEGMSWDNRELWHLDHIYPVSLAKNKEHLLQLNHYTNFQPLWAEDNLKKGNKLIGNF